MALSSRETYFLNLPHIEPPELFQHIAPSGKPASNAAEAAKSAWEFTNFVARLTQWRWALADASIMNNPSVPKSGDTGGAGSSPPANPVAKQP